MLKKLFRVEPEYPHFANLLLAFVIRLEGSRPLKVLELECLTPSERALLETRGHHVTTMHGRDIRLASAQNIRVASQSSPETGVSGQGLSHTFDVIIARESFIGRAPTSFAALQASAKMLRPGGCLVLALDHLETLNSHSKRPAEAGSKDDSSETLSAMATQDNVESVDGLLQAAGFELCDVCGDDQNLYSIEQMYAAELRQVESEVTSSERPSEQFPKAIRYVLTARQRTEAPRVVCLVPDMTLGIFQFRILQPLENWRRRFGGLVRYRVFGYHRAEDLLWGDVFVFQRVGSPQTLHLIKALKAHGKRVVFEIDDLLTTLPEFMRHHQGSKASQLALNESIALADIVTTTTERLATQLRPLNPQVCCVPNCISTLPPYRQAHQENPDMTISIVVAASDRVLVDVLVPPLLLLQTKYGDQLRIYIIGPIAEAFGNSGLRIERLPVMPYAAFRAFLQEVENPIGLIPLDDSLFSSCKSPIKYFDYAVAQVPAVCSNVPPYSDYVRDGDTGLLVNNDSDAWFEAVESLILSQAKRQNLSDAARQYVIQTHLEDEAGRAWQSVAQAMVIERRPTPGLIEDAKLPFVISSDLGWILRKLVSPSTYGKLAKVIAREGFAGLTKRIVR